MRPMRLSVASVTLLTALTMGACGGDSSGEGASVSTPMTVSAAADDNVTVGGRVILRSGGGLQAPLDGIKVILTPQDGGQAYTVVSDDAGHFSVEVPPGTYDATLEGIGAGQEFESVEVEVPEGETSLQVPPLTVSG
jgi:ABC-type Fe3+-hydroxamate transport system substrate-binding protein